MATTPEPGPFHWGAAALLVAAQNAARSMTQLPSAPAARRKAALFEACPTGSDGVDPASDFAEQVEGLEKPIHRDSPAAT